MKISKFANYPISKTLKASLSIDKSITGQGYKLKRAYGTIETTDTNYGISSIDEIEEVIDNSSGSLKLIYMSMVYEKDGETLDVEISHSKGHYIKLTCSGPSITDIEALLLTLSSDIFKTPYYRHSPKTDSANNQKEIRGSVCAILSSTDDLQVRSLGIIQNEKDFQNFLYPVLRSHFEDLEDEHYLPKYGTKTYKPDFGIPSGKLLIEAKFIKTKADLKRIQSELHDDVVGYLGSSDKYNKVVVVVYNFGSVAVDSKELKQLERTKGIASIIVCNHVIPNNLEGKK